MALVFSVGFSLPLLRIRTIMLEQEGYVVRECHILSEIETDIAAEVPDLVLICHSVPLTERRHLIQMILKLERHVPIVCIEANAFQGHVVDCESAENDPETLLMLLRTMIEKLPASGPSSRAKKQNEPLF